MSKALVSNPPLPGEEEKEGQAEAAEESVPQPTTLKRKGKEVDVEGSKKKSKPSILLRAGDDLKIGEEDTPPQTTPRKSTRSAAPASRPIVEPRARASPRQAAQPSSSPRPTTRSTQ